MTKLAALALVITVAGAPRAFGESEPRTNRLGDQDQQFVTQAAEGGNAEIEMAELVTKNGEAAEVKKFAERMIEDHRRANAELARMAKSKGAVLPKGPGAAQTLILEDLRDLRGKELDAAYMKTQVEAHGKMRALLEKQASHGRDGDLKKFATETLATVEQHAALAKKLSGEKH